jgi:hypothetical protein
MLLGEFSFPSSAQRLASIILSILSLHILFFFFIGFILSLRKMSYLHLMFVLWFVLAVLSLISYRHSYPFAPNGDFRFILHALIPCIYFSILGIHFFMERKFEMLGYFAYMLSYVLLMGSSILFIIPLFLCIRHYFYKKYQRGTLGSFGYLLVYAFMIGSSIFFIIPLVGEPQS